MAQGVLGFQYDEEKREGNLTSLGGLPLYLELAHVSGLVDAIRAHLCARSGGQGWTDTQVVMALVLLNLAGGESISDLEVIEQDEGFARILRGAELQGLPRARRRELERRWRKKRQRTVPSPSAVLRYLAVFHDAAQEKGRVPGTAFIPESNENLRALARVNAQFVGFVQARDPQDVATLDIDATLIETHKEAATFCYKGFKSYQPFNVWWAEQGLMLFTEFRDGNVPAKFENLRVLREALEFIPDGVKKVRLRSDTAGYQHELLQYCVKGSHERFGVIEFAISCNVSPEFKAAVAEASEWEILYREEDGQRVKTKREWAEVPFVPDGMGFTKKTTPYRYLATRELMGEQPLPGMEEPQTLPFPTMSWNGQRYKVFGIVTNFRKPPEDEVDQEIERVRKKTDEEETEAWTGDAVIRWLNQRCGRSEAAHSTMKSELAGGKLPCGDFGKNAAWWWCMILALNLNAAMKRLVLGGSWVHRGLKAIRFHLIHIAGRIILGGHELKLRIGRSLEALGVLVRARERMRILSSPAPG